MAAEKSEALVLNSVPFSNTSLIVTLYTREFGKFSAVAQGARREKNPFDNGLDIMARLSAIHYPRKEGLQLLTQARLERWFRVDRNNLSALYAGYYVIELLDALTADFDPIPELFDLTDFTLAELTYGGPVWQLLTRFQWQILRINGIQPTFDRCVLCNRRKSPAAVQTVNILEGGLVCSACLEAQPDDVRRQSPIRTVRQTVRRRLTVGERADSVVNVSGAVLELVRQYMNPQHNLWQKIKVSDANRRELRSFSDLYIAHVLGWKPRMQRFSHFFV